MTAIKYINNKELLLEIQRSKATYCYFAAKEHVLYDTIISSLDMLTPELVSITVLHKASKLSTKAEPVDPKSIKPESIVFRVMTDSHLPPETNEKKRKKSSTGEWVTRPNFPPFKQYILKEGIPVEIGRSHWKGDLETGNFCIDHGKITDRLARMFMMLVEQYSHKGNWRNYCCDFSTEALTQRGWLGIDEITKDDMILSYDDRKLKWSKIKSIFRGDYDGKMFHLMTKNIDALVTPGHKFVTESGLKRVESLTNDDIIILDIAFPQLILTEQMNTKFITIVDYSGKIWCPETEYGSFMARRNDYIYLTGNSYRSEMTNSALLHLCSVALQFNESLSNNPFAYLTQVVKHVFVRILNLEKRHQSIRDDLLLMAGATPSFTRQLENDMEQKDHYSPSMSEIHVVSAGNKSDSEAELIKKEFKKRGRKPKISQA